MSRVEHFQVTANRKVAENTYVLELSGDTSGIERPGQFVNVEVPGHYLRRPLSVCDWDENTLYLLYKVFGPGTEDMTRLPEGQTLNVLSALGNGFHAPKEIKRPLVVGGGIGIAPMLALVSHLVDRGLKPQVILGFGTADEVTMVDPIESLGADVLITTIDGTVGTKGLVTDGMRDLRTAGATWDYVYACGPTPMLKAVFAQADAPGQYSMEERMACGFGACVGCVIETNEGVLRVCKEGPVFESELLPW